MASTSANAIKLPKIKTVKVVQAANAPPLGKFLASNDKPVRDKAVAGLSSYLKGTSKIIEEEILEVGELNWEQEWIVDARLSSLEMAKLWKGIFFCFWMSDKPLVQQALANDLSNLLLDVRPGKKNSSGKGRVARFRSALAYLRGFWEAVVREWSGLDRLRLDKFYLLIRRFVGAAFKLLAREDWDLKAIAEYNEMLTGPGGPLHILDSKIPHSIAYHLADIYVDELEKSLPATPASAVRCVPLIPLLQPFFKTVTISSSTPMWTRITENLFIPLFDYSVPLPPQPKSKRRKTESQLEITQYPRIFEVAEVEGMQGNEEFETGKRMCGEGILAELFAQASIPETNEVNRRKMYKLWREKSGEEAA